MAIIYAEELLRAIVRRKKLEWERDPSSHPSARAKARRGGGALGSPPIKVAHAPSPPGGRAAPAGGAAGGGGGGGRGGGAGGRGGGAPAASRGSGRQGGQAGGRGGRKELPPASALPPPRGRVDA